MDEAEQISGRNEGRRRSEPKGSHLSERARFFEKALLVHLGVMIVGLSWSFGGQIGWARQALLAWGSLGILLFVAIAVAKPAKASLARHLWPLLAFDVIAIASCFNPSFASIVRDGQPFFMLVDPPYRWLPSSARPDLTWRALWQLNAIVLSSYNLILTVHRRRTLRRLLLVIAGNAVVLAIFGTFQKLAGAKGLWFGLVDTPQSYFFSTFVYHNHWGAFTLLNIGACLGLLFYFWRRHDQRDVWHSPVPAGALAVVVLAATIPLSGSRSSTILAGLFLLGSLLHALFALGRRRRESGGAARGPVVMFIIGAALAVAAIVWLGYDVIGQRARLTGEQIAQAQVETSPDSRLTLYRDTIRMGMVRPWFGWGLETYGDVFRIYNSQRAVEVHFGQPYYRAAHSDWLQLFAETGAVGTALIGLLVLGLLRSIRWRSAAAIPRYLIGGCALVLLYAWLEFPFANPSVLVAFWCSLCIATRYAMLDPGRPAQQPAT
jgi:O-Antigen ligase